MVVFLIGMRVNRWRAVRHWLPVIAAMPRMLKELSRDGESGLLGLRGLGGGPRVHGVVQYWESHEKLLAYASAQGREHPRQRGARMLSMMRVQLSLPWPSLIACR